MTNKINYRANSGMTKGTDSRDWRRRNDLKLHCRRNDKTKTSLPGENFVIAGREPGNLLSLTSLLRLRGNLPFLLYRYNLHNQPLWFRGQYFIFIVCLCSPRVISSDSCHSGIYTYLSKITW